MDRNKILKMVAILAAIIVIASSLSRLAGGNSMSLSEYAALNASPSPSASPAPENSQPDTTSSPAPETASPSPVFSTLTGASLNGNSQLKERTTYTDGFYYEPISDNLRRYMTGVSYPVTEDAPASEKSSPESPAPSASIADFDKLRYVHIWHYNFSGQPAEGELICNEYIAQDLVEIFYELYRNEYQLEKVLLIDEYEGDADAAREDNNSFCFYASQASDTSQSAAPATALANHTLGLALDINPRYNPEISYSAAGQSVVTPASAAEYTDRAASFPYKIDENDLCYKLFTGHGFTWGGNRNNGKSYQHFQKSAP